jgi:hypothetical protein
MRYRWMVLFLALIIAMPAFAQRGAGGAGAAGAPGGAGGRGAAPPLPTPHWPDGRVNFNAPPGQPGLWAGNGGRLAVNPNSYEPNATRNAPIHIDDVPIQDWAKALTNFRHLNSLADEPHARCKVSPGPREFVAPYGIEILDVPEEKRIYILDVGGPHTFRTIYMDGRPHPTGLALVPSYYGHSIGKWEGEVLVIDTVGMNERSWMNRDGIPHTDRLHLIERVSRPDFNTLKYEVTIDDPGAFTRPWNTSFSLNWSPGAEVFEYICQDNNQAPEMMVGNEGVLRTPKFVP